MPAAALTLERLGVFLLASSVGPSRAFFSQLQLRGPSCYSSRSQLGYIASTAFVAIRTAAAQPVSGSRSCSAASGSRHSFCTTTASAASTTMAQGGFESRSIDQVGVCTSGGLCVYFLLYGPTPSRVRDTFTRSVKICSVLKRA